MSINGFFLVIDKQGERHRLIKYKKTFDMMCLIKTIHNTSQLKSRDNYKSDLTNDIYTSYRTKRTNKRQ